MAIETVRYDDPHAALGAAEPFLAREPILNNLILTLLAARAVTDTAADTPADTAAAASTLDPEAGRYWIARESRDGPVVGVAMQSPLDRPMILSSMSAGVAGAMGSAVGAELPELPGVHGEAQLAARFAAQYAECRGVGASPVAGRRIYEARVVRDGRPVRGVIVQPTMAHHALVSDWATAFGAEIGEPAPSASRVGRQISAGDFWLWDDAGFRSIASLRPAAHGAVRMSLVYTPPEHRGSGYAEALVRGLTRQLLGGGLRPMLYTDLANPTSNGVYRRVGYEAVAEMILYRFAARG